MLGLAFKYSYLNAKVRTIYSQRLKESDWRVLSHFGDQVSFVQYLKTTYYSRWINTIFQDAKRGSETFERQIYSSLFNDYLKIARNLKPAPKRLLMSMLSRYEAENIKTLLRAKKGGLSQKAVWHLLYPVESFSRINWEELWKSKDVKETMEKLLDTCFGPALAHALPQFEAQARLFPVEMALEIQSYRCILDALLAISCKKDRQMAKNLIGAFVDTKNVCHVARLRFLYRLSTEESLNYTYPGGLMLNLKRLHNVCRATSLQEFIDSLPVQLKEELHETQDLLGLKISMEQWLLKRLKKAFLGLPFHIGVEIAWLFYKELEIEAVIRLFGTKGTKHRIEIQKLIPKALLKEE